MDWLEQETHRKYHEVASLFPLMEGEDYEQLKADIKANGLLEAIWLRPDGSILDGRNRHRACIETEVQPRFRTWSGGGSLVGFVVSMNLHRRHLNESQRGMVASKIANMPLGGATYRSANLPTDGVSQAEAAMMMNVSDRTLRYAVQVREHGTPELIKAVEQGDVVVSLAAKIAEWEDEKQQSFLDLVNAGKTPSQAARQIVHEEKRTQPFPAGKYLVIYADPPWSYSNTGFDEAASAQYPTMTVEEISSLPVGDLTTARSVLFLWATNPLLPEALKVMKAWGFEYKTNMAWVKDKARGKGWWLKAKHELLLIGVRKEAPQPAMRPPSAFEADRGPVHSRKPERVYEIIEAMYSGTKVELFSRNMRGGWTMWGNENATT